MGKQIQGLGDVGIGTATPKEGMEICTGMICPRKDWKEYSTKVVLKESMSEM
jgi:hypothetical protein